MSIGLSHFTFWTKLGLLAATLGTGLFAAEAALSLTPAALPLADGARIVIQGVRGYTDPGRASTTENLIASFVRATPWELFPGSGKTAHLLAKDMTPSEANVFTVKAVLPRPATFPVAKSFGPDCQFIVLQAPNGKYLGFMDDDMLGAVMDSEDDAQILLVDHGDPLVVYITPLTYGRRDKLNIFVWPPIRGAQLLFCRVRTDTLWQTYPRPTETPSLAGATRILLVK